MSQPKKVCEECAEPIIGRVDKRFCGDQCRSAFHNRFMKENHKVVRNTNRILRKNRSLLDRFRTNGITDIDLVQLSEMGFRAGYVTGIYVDRREEVIYFCYDQAFRQINGSKIRLVDSEVGDQVI